MPIDNTIIASFLGAAPRGMSNVGDSFFDNGLLRMGEVKKRILPSNPKSNTKKLVEYDVEVVHRNGMDASATTTYRCLAGNGFGGLADKTDVSYRIDTSRTKGSSGNGARVLILCINGDQSKGIILGGIDPEEAKHEEKGHHYIFEFNGIRFAINDEGEAELIHRGPTNNDGSVKEQYEPQSGSAIKLTKDGSISITDQKGQSIELNAQDESLEGLVNKRLFIDINGTAELSSGEDFTVQSEEAVIINAQQGLLVGEANNKMMLGSTYRDSESTMNTTLSKSLQASAILANTAAVNLQLAAVAVSLPVVGGVLAAPFLTLASQALLQMGTAMNSMGQSIDSFESQQDRYLSKKNWND